MQLNHDKNRRTLVHGALLPWISSLAPGVQRRMFYREGREQAIATSMVRYEPGSRFPSHGHPGGEEFLVIEGIFQDERGDYPVGTYVRNPPGSSHTPASTTGCVIFVRLQQFSEDDLQECVVHSDSEYAGIGGQILFSDQNEHVTLHDCPSHAQLHLPSDAGLELLMLSGSLEENGDLLKVSSWLRLPPGSALHATAGHAGAKVWIKRLRTMTHSRLSGET